MSKRRCYRCQRRNFGREPPSNASSTCWTSVHKIRCSFKFQTHSNFADPDQNAEEEVRELGKAFRRMQAADKRYREESELWLLRHEVALQELNRDNTTTERRLEALSNLSLLQHRNRQLETEMKSLQAGHEKHNGQVRRTEAQLDDLLLQQQDYLTESFTLYKQRHDFHRIISDLMEIREVRDAYQKWAKYGHVGNVGWRKT